MSAKKVVPRSAFFDEVRAILAQARQRAYAAVNVAMVEAYWEIGRRIVEEEQQGKERAEYGAALIKELSKQLTAEFGKGFAVANIKNFKQFYLTVPDFQKSYALCSLLSWPHYRLIMRVEGESAREYYIRETAEQSSPSVAATNIREGYKGIALKVLLAHRRCMEVLGDKEARFHVENKKLIMN